MNAATASAQAETKALSNLALAPLPAVMEGVRRRSREERLENLLSDDEDPGDADEDAAGDGLWSGYGDGYSCGQHHGTAAWEECLATRNAHRDRIGFDRDLLEGVACTPKLSPGDAVLFLEHVFHRTQDMAAHRVAMLINLT